MDNHLHVAIATDDAYTMYAGIMLYSLFENNEVFKRITVHVLDNGITNDGKKRLEDIVNSFGRNICYYNCSEIDNWLGKEIVNMFNTSVTNVPITSYARLFLPKLIDSDIDKILYLDVDGIVLGDFMELWCKDIHEFSALGAMDNVGSKAKECIGLDKTYKYINAGVLLLNLKQLRENKFITKMKTFISQYNGNVYHHDQGIINGVLHDSIGYLEPEYNMMSFMFEHKKASYIEKRYSIQNYYSTNQIEYAKNNPVFIHFTEGNLLRPWVKGCRHPLKYIWEEYRDKTVWRDTKLESDKRSFKLKLLAKINLYLPAAFVNYIMKCREDLI